MYLNTLGPRYFKCIFFNENVWIPIKISLEIVPKVRINNIPALVQMMAWYRDQATSYCLNQWWLACRRIYASLGLNELRNVEICFYFSVISRHWGGHVNENPSFHYSDVIMSAIASRLFAQPFVKIKGKSSSSLAFVRGIQRWLVVSTHKGQ